MEKIYNSIKKISKLCIIIGLAFALLMSLIFGVLGADKEFIPFLADSFSSLLFIALYALPIVFLLMKNKEKEAKFFLIILLITWLINTCSNLISGGYSVGQYYSNMAKVYGVFSFITGLAFLACLVLFVLAKIFNLKVYKVLNILVLVQLALFFIFFIVTIIRNIDYNSDWSSYFSAINSTLVLPFTYVCIMIYLNDDRPIEDKTSNEVQTSDEAQTSKDVQEEQVAEEAQNEDQTSNEVQTSEDEQTTEEEKPEE